MFLIYFQKNNLRGKSSIVSSNPFHKSLVILATGHKNIFMSLIESVNSYKQGSFDTMKNRHVFLMCSEQKCVHVSLRITRDPYWNLKMKIRYVYRFHSGKSSPKYLYNPQFLKFTVKRKCLYVYSLQWMKMTRKQVSNMYTYVNSYFEPFQTFSLLFWNHI